MSQLVLAVAMCLVFGPGGGKRMTVESALDRIRQEEFLRAETLWASDAHTAYRFIADSAEVEALKDCGRPILAELEKNALSLLGKPPSEQGPLVAYAAVFAQNADTEAIPILTRFLRSYPVERVDYLFERENPLVAAIAALAVLAPGSFSVPDDLDLMAQRLAIAKAADRWYANHVSPTARKCPKCGSPVREGKKLCGKDGTPVP